MGEIFFRRCFAFLFLLICSLFSIAVFSADVFASHPLYSNFSSPESGFSFNSNSNLVSATDTAVYSVGYYSINGSAWQNFTLAGAFYPSSISWLTGTATATLPSFGVGEHYIIVYSCAYNFSNFSWDCHENKWQLIIVNSSNVSGGPSFDNFNISAAACGDILDYQCGIKVLCGQSVNYGNCSQGYVCVNNLCIASETKSCQDIVCNSGEYCSQGVCLLDVSGRTYFVATGGNDNWPGTLAQPWRTWQKGFDTAQAGDVVYFRGGVWYPNVYVTHDTSSGHGHNGTSSNYIYFFNYPGEKPILDCINITSSIDEAALAIVSSSYTKFRGFTVRNKKEQFYNNFISAVQILDCGNVSIDRISSHDNGGYGFRFYSYDQLNVTNCDSYNNADIMSPDPGNRADGFSIGAGGSDTDTFKKIYITGCRAWNNSDDGFDIGSSKQFDVSNSWSFYNGYLPYGGGVGFKYAPSYVQDPGKRKTYNTIAAGNNYDGYAAQNLQAELAGPVGEFLNNFAYRCNMGFTSDVGSFNCNTGYTKSIYRNNLVFQSTYGVVDENYPSYYNQVYLTLCHYNYPNYNASNFIQEHNSWIPMADPPFWLYNPAVTVTGNDFVSLDISQLMRPRKADGNLPDITFGHLKAGSDLIDKGIYVGLPYSGAAPDLGPFEYGSSQSRLPYTIESQTLNIDNLGYQGIDIPRNVPTALTFRNNFLTSSNNDGYMLQCGDDDYGTTVHNLDNAIILGNKFMWTGIPGSPQIHGIMAGYNINYNIKYNYLNGPYYGIVWEGGSSDGKTMVNTAGGVYYNIFKNSKLILAGFENDYIYNNIFYSNVSTYTIRVVSNDQLATSAITKNVKIKNNIFYATNNAHAIEINSENLAGFESDYNVYYWTNISGNLPLFLVDSVETTWTQWRALGYDAHSVVINPNFIDMVNFVPVSRLNYGTNLGAEFLNGLSTSATWGTTDPATNTQNGVWQVGVRVY